MMEEEKETLTIFDNDYIEYCKNCAPYWKDFMHEYLPMFQDDTEIPQALLERLGMKEEDIEDFLDEFSAIGDEEEAITALEEKIDELSPTEREQRIVANFFEDQMFHDPEDVFHDMFEEDIHENIAIDYEDALRLRNNEPHLVLGTNMGWRNLDGRAIFHPEDDIATSIIESYQTDLILNIRHTEGDPYLRATAYTHDSPTGEGLVIIPETWAKEAFESKELHEKLVNLMEIDDAVKNFFVDAKAIDSLEKDPVTYGIVDGVKDYAAFLAENAKNKQEALSTVAAKLANFHADEMETVCQGQELEWNVLTPSLAKARFDGDAKELSNAMSNSTFYYLDQLKPAKESLLTKGFEKVLKDTPDNLRKTLENFVNHPKKAVPAIQKLGQEAQTR